MSCSTRSTWDKKSFGGADVHLTFAFSEYIVGLHSSFYIWILYAQYFSKKTNAIRGGECKMQANIKCKENKS